MAMECSFPFGIYSGCRFNLCLFYYSPLGCDYSHVICSKRKFGPVKLPISVFLPQWYPNKCLTLQYSASDVSAIPYNYDSCKVVFPSFMNKFTAYLRLSRLSGQPVFSTSVAFSELYLPKTLKAASTVRLEKPISVRKEMRESGGEGEGRLAAFLARLVLLQDSTPEGLGSIVFCFTCAARYWLTHTAASCTVVYKLLS